jgi:tetratricopeptide (TPR) repeat protein
MKGDHDRAIDDFDEALRLDPGYVLAYLNRGESWQSLGDLDRAVQDFSTAIRRDPTLYTAWVCRGGIYMTRSSYAAAETDFTAALRHNPKCAYTLHQRALARAARCNFPGALADYEASLRLDPNVALVYQHRGVTRICVDDFAGSVSDFEQAIRLDPQMPHAYGGKAWVLATCPDGRYRDGGRAVELARKACELTGWRDPMFVEVLAAAVAEAGRFDEAVRFQEQAMALPPYPYYQVGTPEERLQLYRRGRPLRDRRGPRFPAA